MAANKERQSKVMGQIAAINTLLERYPVLTTTDPMLTNFSINTSVGFLLDLLSLLGVSYKDLVQWLCRVLGSREDGGQGLLDDIEYAIKTVLMVNARDILTCAINPNIPDYMLKYAHQNGREDPEGCRGIAINLGAMDIFGLLFNCPSDKKGSIFYFDAYESGYRPHELYKSNDFNAFLWYVINKGNITNGTDSLKNTWDNRVKLRKVLNSDNGLKDAFFEPAVIPRSRVSGPDIPITSGSKTIEKKQYVICDYQEKNGGQIKVYLNADRYYRTRKVGNILMNRTIFEFNYDYIYSLKLFDTKTLLANISNSLLGLASSASVSFAYTSKMVQEQIKQIVDKVITSDDIDVSDCYFSFSNDDFNNMLNQTNESYNGRYTGYQGTYDPSYDNVFDTINNVNSESTRNVDQKTLIGNVIGQVMETSAIKNDIENEFKFNYSIDFIKKFLSQTITEMVLQILSPKVNLLYAVNRAMIGDASDIQSMSNLMKDLINVIVSITKQIKDILVKALYDWMIEELKPLLELFIAKLALETIKAYKDLISDLILNCIPNFSPLGTMSSVTIDNVNYADIVKLKESPDQSNC